MNRIVERLNFYSSKIVFNGYKIIKKYDSCFSTIMNKILNFIKKQFQYLTLNLFKIFLEKIIAHKVMLHRTIRT